MAMCPAGHPSTQADFCDTCGLPIEAGVPAASPPPTESEPTAPPVIICPGCHSSNVAEALFCEACGFDFTTGLPAAPLPESTEPTALTTTSPAGPVVEWVAELWIDPDWYAAQGSTEPLPSPGLPDIVPLIKDSHLIGRVSVSRNIYPEVDCELDTGCSRRHARLSTDGSRWWVEDLESANGTFIGPASGPLPAMPIPRGRVELASDQRIYVGAWTRIVIRRATADEQAAFAGVAV